MSEPRSYLFVPGDRGDRFAKAVASGADSVIFDLEDAVAPGEKDDARDQVCRWIAETGTGIVRINPVGSSWFEADVAACKQLPPAVSIMVPKAQPQVLRQVSQMCPDRALIALIETVEGLVSLRQVGTQGIARLAFGNLDFGTDARVPGVGSELDSVRLQLALESRLANLPPPIDGVTVALEDTEGLMADIERARNLGFTGKLCIHPKQVSSVNEGFLPSADELDWARRVLKAADDTSGAVVSVDGKMVDRPVIKRAREFLSRVRDSE